MYSHMHSSQKLCMHGPLRGFVKTSRQIGHLHSWTRAKSAFSRCLASSSMRAAPRRPRIDLKTAVRDLPSLPPPSFYPLSLPVHDLASALR